MYWIHLSTTAAAQTQDPLYTTEPCFHCGHRQTSVTHEGAECVFKRVKVSMFVYRSVSVLGFVCQRERGGKQRKDVSVCEADHCFNHRSAALTSVLCLVHKIKQT